MPTGASTLTVPLWSTSEVIGSSDASLPIYLAGSGSGLVGVTGSSVATLPSLIASGQVYPRGGSALSVGFISGAATGLVGVIGSSSQTLEAIVANAMGYEPASGASDLVLPAWIARGHGFTSLDTFSAIAMHTETLALSTYTNFSFNSMGRFNGAYLAASDDGLFVLDGSDDAGTPIDAYARLNESDLGTSHLKLVDRMYVGYRTSGGNLVLRVRADGVVRDYRLVRSGNPNLHGAHVRLGMGVRARYFQFEVRNQSGADFDFNMMELKPTVLKRRVGKDDA